MRKDEKIIETQTKGFIMERTNTIGRVGYFHYKKEVHHFFSLEKGWDLLHECSEESPAQFISKWDQGTMWDDGALCYWDFTPIPKKIPVVKTGIILTNRKPIFRGLDESDADFKNCILFFDSNMDRDNKKDELNANYEAFNKKINSIPDSEWNDLSFDSNWKDFFPFEYKPLSY